MAGFEGAEPFRKDGEFADRELLDGEFAENVVPYVEDGGARNAGTSGAAVSRQKAGNHRNDKNRPVKLARSGQNDAGAPRHDIVGSSRAVKELRERIDAFAEHDESVLICGETGVGKEGVAQALHARSARRGGPFVVRNVGRLDRDLIGSDFFGHVRGAFTGAVDRRDGAFATADGGVLHLDEIGEMPISLQTNLLRVLEDGVITPVGSEASRIVDVRVIAATNRDLAAARKTGAFRDDLYHRLNIFRINVPPLRARGEDVIEIAEYWLARRAAKTGCVKRLSPAAADRLRAHDWPGNIRELKNTIIRAGVLARGELIGAEHLSFDDRGAEPAFDIGEGCELLTRYLAALALERENGVVLRAAERVNMNRTSFHKLKNALTDGGRSANDLRADLMNFLDAR